MSDSDISESDCFAFNYDYENCIVTRNDDEDVSSSSDNEELLQQFNGTSEDSDSDSVMNMTCSQVMEAELNTEETLIFLLGMLNRIEKYLNNLEKDVHRKWLESHISLTKTALARHFRLLQAATETSVTVKNVKKEPTAKTGKVNHVNKRKVTAKTQKQKQSVKKGKNANRQDSQPSVSGKNLTSTPVQTGQSNTKQNLKYNRKDYQLVYCDKWTYNSLNLSAIAIVPPKASRSKASRGKSTTKKNKSMEKSQVIKQSDAGQSAQTSSSVKKSVRNKRLNTVLQKKSSELNKTGFNKNTNEKSRPNKRRAVSLSAVNSKRAKSCGNTSSDTRLNVTEGTGKRKLYSPDTWMNSLPAVLLNSSEQS